MSSESDLSDIGNYSEQSEEEISDYEHPQISDEDEDDEYEESPTPIPPPQPKKKQGMRVKLKLKKPSPLSQTVVSKRPARNAKTNAKALNEYDDEDLEEGDVLKEDGENPSEEEAITKPRNRGTPVTAQPPTKKVKLSVPKRATKLDSKYNDEEDEFDFDEYEDDDGDIIPTPALDDEGLSTSDEEETTPDLSKMTERQRARLLDDTPETELVSLSNKASKRKELTAEETELRRAETARKRKNMLEKKLDEEKRETIDKLLKRRAVKTGTRRQESEDVGDTRERPRRPLISHPALITWVSQRDGERLRVPDALLK